MPNQYRPAPEVRVIGEALIAAHHTHLCEVPVDYYFCAESEKKLGRELMGTARKIGGLNAFLANPVEVTGRGGEPLFADVQPFFVIMISEPIWTDLSEAQRAALVDHELAHCWVEEDDEGGTKLTLLNHDVEEFYAIIQRHGIWERGVKLFADVCKNAQLTLPLADRVDPSIQQAIDRDTGVIR